MRAGYFNLKVNRPICGQKGASVIFDTDTVWVLKQRIFEDEVEGVCVCEREACSLGSYHFVRWLDEC